MEGLLRKSALPQDSDTISAGIAEVTIDLSPPPGEDMSHEATWGYLS